MDPANPVESGGVAKSRDGTVEDWSGLLGGASLRIDPEQVPFDVSSARADVLVARPCLGRDRQCR